jgi:hypothetical protein
MATLLSIWSHSPAMTTPLTVVWYVGPVEGVYALSVLSNSGTNLKTYELVNELHSFIHVALPGMPENALYGSASYGTPCWFSPLWNDDAEAVNTTPRTVTVAALSAGTAGVVRDLSGFPVALHVETDPPEQGRQGWGSGCAGVQKKPEGHGRQVGGVKASQLLEEAG